MKKAQKEGILISSLNEKEKYKKVCMKMAQEY
jgi:hypothetical protein